MAFPSISPRGKTLPPRRALSAPMSDFRNSCPLCPALPLGDGCASSRALLPGAPSTHIRLHIHTCRGTSFLQPYSILKNSLCAKSLHTESELLSVYVSALLFLCLVFCLDFTMFAKECLYICIARIFLTPLESTLVLLCSTEDAHPNSSPPTSVQLPKFPHFFS